MGTLGGMAPYESWIDRQIREATERGEFDNLPGAGQPIPGLNGREDPNWWVRGLLERENLKPVLPTALSLRKEVEDIDGLVADARTEAEVREIADDLNARIVDARVRMVDGPQIWVKKVDVESLVRRWHDRRAGRN